MADLEPAPVMVTGPCPGFVGDEGRAAVITILERPIGIRSPTARDIGWLPGLAFPHLYPASIRVERIAAVKIIALDTNFIGPVLDKTAA